jgi:hypothetical protein
MQSQGDRGGLPRADGTIRTVVQNRYGLPLLEIGDIGKPMA